MIRVPRIGQTWVKNEFLTPLKLSYYKPSFLKMFVVAKVVFASLPQHDLKRNTVGQTQAALS
jgi:hypothetical protein